MDIDGDTSTIVFDETAPIVCETESDVGTVTCEGFIYGVINDFLDTVITTARISRADVHTGAFSDCFESFEDLDLTSSVLRFFFI
jgi:hypothetical protein